MSEAIDLPGFADPVADAQATFRGILAAIAVPGSLHPAGIGLTPPIPLAPATAAAALTLADVDTPLAIDAAMLPARAWLAFHCGAPWAEPAQARFVLAATCPDLATLPAGGDETPEDSATLILQLPALGEGPAYRLSGPGLRAASMFRAQGLPGDFAARWAANHRRYPRGVDLLLCAGTTIAALPRSVTVENA